MNAFTIQKILVPVDFSETGMLALEHAAFLAKLSKSELLIVHVLPETPYYVEIPDPAFLIQNREKLNEIVTEKLTETVERIRKEYGITAKAFSRDGRIAYELLLLSKEENVDLIVMGTHGASGMQEYFIGSNAHKVVNTAHCPVITVRTHAKRIGFTRIVLPIDQSMHSREKVEPAIALAAMYNAKLYVVGLLESNDAKEEAKLNLILDQVQHAIEKSGLTFARHISHDQNLAAAAMREAKAVDADLIIIMTDHEQELTGGFMGMFAKQIVNHSSIPVMSFRPHESKITPLDMGGM